MVISPCCRLFLGGALALLLLTADGEASCAGDNAKVTTMTTWVHDVLQEHVYPRVYTATVNKNDNNNVVNNFVAQVDVLDIFELDEDFLKVSFMVHSQSQLDYVMDIVSSLSSQQEAFNLLIDSEATQTFIDRANLVKTGDHRQLQDYTTISGYPCFRDLAGTEQLMADLVVLGNSSPHNISVTLEAIGESYLKTQDPLQGYDIWALRITGNGVAARNMKTEKGVLFVMTGLHAREYAPPELAARWAETLITGYGNDPEITAVMDHSEVHLVLQSNPDGRNEVETGTNPFRRKNLNPSSGNQSVCGSSSYGVDLNRNFPFQWGLDSGSSEFACTETFRGVAPASEPEVQAIVNYASSIFSKSQRKDDPLEQRDEAYPQTANGVFLDIHSYGGEIIYPWGHENRETGNAIDLEALARKYSHFNSYSLSGPGNRWLFPASGASDDWAFGTLGAAGMTFEVGTNFYEDCDSFNQQVVPEILPVLLYAAKIARAPYSLPKGPDVTSLRLSSSSLPSDTGSSLTIMAQVSDSAFSSNGFTTSQQTVSLVLLFIDQHPYDLEENGNAPPGLPMAFQNNAGTESYSLTLSMSEILSEISIPVVGRHSLYVQGTDSDDYNGPVAAAFFEITQAAAPPPAGFTSTPIARPTTLPAATPSEAPTAKVPVTLDHTMTPASAPFSAPAESTKFTTTAISDAAPNGSGIFHSHPKSAPLALVLCVGVIVLL